jgi:hypothetical protein
MGMPVHCLGNDVSELSLLFRLSGRTPQYYVIHDTQLYDREIAELYRLHPVVYVILMFIL